MDPEETYISERVIESGTTIKVVIVTHNNLDAFQTFRQVKMMDSGIPLFKRDYYIDAKTKATIRPCIKIAKHNSMECQRSLAFN